MNDTVKAVGLVVFLAIVALVEILFRRTTRRIYQSIALLLSRNGVVAF